ncbi:chromatin structure-remodeling complex protein RSC7 [Magnaporthiopsis poae ATCC 64411]|uniref:Chromatin structure-remodeling complex protein RSC7 n=1 Tax=Magnaporthiopsis poae (strain ATCC 64411 / 73-15) TaxID=644358 RepID=A0A0C4DT72_MAGP6|nr:chromatin structure-remodeling complex protein RSC7 [Magnaporthiopsis poae ATCC 64411]
MPNGQLLGGREYRCRTFLVQNRGEKLFMLATECARVLGYRDSYLLFNKNRSLYKIIANQVEKDDLVNQEVLPFSYRSRQIAIVTARSMFRQFGSRVIQHGRRVRDDYWEAKARKQGFTENDLAGEKRPGAAKAREAALEASQNAPILGAPHGEIVYSNTPGQFPGAPQAPLVQPGMIGAPSGSSGRMPVITLGSDYNDTRTRDYSNILKAPRQEITGPAYQDRTQPAPIPELHAQAHHAAEFNRGINHQREMRGEYLQGVWRRPHEQPVQSQPSLAQPIGATADSSAASGTPAGVRAGQHPGQQHSSAHPGGLPQAPSQTQAPGVPSGQSPQLMMTAPPYSQPLTSQTQMQPTRLGSSGSLQQGAQPYSYPQSSQMWQQTPQTPQYSYSHPSQTHQSPHQPPQQHQQQQPSQQPPSQQQQQQQQQPHSQQPSQPPPPPPSIRQQPGAPGGQVQQGSMPYSGIPGMTQGGYTTAASGHGMSYDQTPRQYMHQSPAPAPPPVTQSWSGQAQSSQWWPNQPQ